MTYTLKFILDVITEEMEKAQGASYFCETDREIQSSEYHSLAKLRQKFIEIDNELSKKENENATHDH